MCEVRVAQIVPLIPYSKGIAMGAILKKTLNDFWVKVPGKHSRSVLLSDGRLARSYGVAPCGSDLSERWQNIVTVLLCRVKIHL